MPKKKKAKTKRIEREVIKKKGDKVRELVNPKKEIVECEFGIKRNLNPYIKTKTTFKAKPKETHMIEGVEYLEFKELPGVYFNSNMFV